MRRSSLVGSLLAVVAVACAGGDEPAPFVPGGEETPAVPTTVAPNALETALQQGTGIPWAVDIDARTGFAMFAKPLGALKVGQSGVDTAAFLTKYPQVFGVEPGELNVLREEQDADGTKVVGFQQRLAQTEVVGNALAVHIAPNGTVTSVQGHGFRPNGPSTPAQSEASARAAAAGAAGSPASGTAPLVFLPNPAAAPKAARLAYAVRVREGTSAAAVYFIDANDGALLASQQDLAAAEGSGVGASGVTHYFAVSQAGTPPAAVTYSLESPAGAYPGKLKVIDYSGGGVMDGPAISSPNPNQWVSDATEARRGQAVDAYGYAIAAVKYYSLRFGQNSYDNAGGAIDILVHASGEHNAAGGYLGGRALMLFTDGVPARSYKTFATAPDVVGHELGHLIQTGQLGRKQQTAFEAKTIEEGLADVFGTLFEMSLGIGDPSTVGELAVAGGVRNLEDPSQCNKDSGGPCPADVDDPGMKSDDPHIPSTIVSHAMYLAAFGGENAKLKVRVTDPISTKELEDLYFETVKKCYQTGATYKALAQCQIERAKAKKIPFQPVACAWAAVKVVSLDDAKKRYGVSCDDTLSCEGKKDGYYCAPDRARRKAISYKCGGGKVASQDTCSVCVEYHSDRSKQNCTR